MNSTGPAGATNINMYGTKGASAAQKATLTAVELAFLATAGWLLFGGGDKALLDIFGWPASSAIPARRYLIMGFSIVIFLRMIVTMYYFMHRAIGWSEAAGVLTAFGLYYLGFATLVLPQSAPLGLIDYFAIALFVAGCCLNSCSEYARDRFRKHPANKGKLYTQGLFSWSMHINFFGDVLWVSAYAIVAHTWWAALIPLFTLSFFAFYNVPTLDRHLAVHYGDQFTSYSMRTKKLIPLVW
jgi:protein-S-isoprenylcysteine O-methyltransferase Ste14